MKYSINIFILLTNVPCTYNYIFYLGVPSLGLIKIDPLRIIQLKIDQGTGPVSINMTFNDLDIYNLKSTVISKLQ